MSRPFFRSLSLESTMFDLVLFIAVVLGLGIALKVACGKSVGGATKEVLGNYAKTTGKLTRVAIKGGRTGYRLWR